MSPPTASRPPRRRVRNSRLVREPDRLQTRMLLLTLAGGLVVIVPLMANIWGHVEAVRLGYEIEKAREAGELLAERNRLLRTEHAALRDLSRVQGIATGRLKLEPRRPAATVVVTVVDPPKTRTPETTGDREVVVAASDRRGR